MSHIRPFNWLRIILALGALITILVVLNHRAYELAAWGPLLNPYQGLWSNQVSQFELFGPQRDLRIQGPLDVIKIQVDHNRVRHIFAENDHDLYFAQGYLAANENLWKMEYLVRMARGTLSEIIGEQGLAYDRFFRRLDIDQSAKESSFIILQDEVTGPAVRSYVEGINAYIGSLSPKQLPFEYRLLGHAPVQWGAQDVVVIFKLIMLHHELRGYAWPDATAYLGIKPTPLWSPFDKELSLLSQPMRLHTKVLSHESSGVEVPGVPGLFYGMTTKFRWGASASPIINSEQERSDSPKLQSFRYRDVRRTEYLYEGNWRPIVSHEEPIKVRGKRSETIVIRRTHLGPVIDPSGSVVSEGDSANADHSSNGGAASLSDNASAQNSSAQDGPSESQFIMGLVAHARTLESNNDFKALMAFNKANSLASCREPSREFFLAAFGYLCVGVDRAPADALWINNSNLNFLSISPSLDSRSHGRWTVRGVQ